MEWLEDITYWLEDRFGTHAWLKVGGLGLALVVLLGIGNYLMQQEPEPIMDDTNTVEVRDSSTLTETITTDEEVGSDVDNTKEEIDASAGIYEGADFTYKTDMSSGLYTYGVSYLDMDTTQLEELEIPLFMTSSKEDRNSQLGEDYDNNFVVVYDGVIYPIDGVSMDRVVATWKSVSR